MDSKFDNHFRDLFENTNDLIYFLKLDDEIELVNRAWLQTLGYEHGEVIGRNFNEFIHPAYEEKFRKTRQEALTNNKTKTVELGLVSSKNELIIGEAQLGCSYKNGAPQYTICVFKNLSENQRTERIVRENEKRLKAFLNGAPDAVIVINELQEILQWNPKAEAIFGFSFEEMKNKTLTETIIPPRYREAHLKGMQHFLLTGEGPILNKTIEITALHKNGKEIFINLSISSVKLEDDWVFIAFLSDISKRKATEEALIKKEAELLQSKKLQERNDQFISTASHELKTPLTTIKAYSELTLAMCSDDQSDIKTNLCKINQFTDKLTFLINDLLNVSKINFGKMTLSKTRIKFDSFLNETLEAIQKITTHRIIIERNDAVEIIADPVRLEQVVANIVSNAVKYSPGENKIVVRSIKKENELVCSFTDFGIGIAPEDLEKVFMRFFRADVYSYRFTGFGIGLFIAHEIISLHGGKMWAESEPGQGSCFYFSLPFEGEPANYNRPNATLTEQSSADNY
jgi:PAS domain S-box-containing protein